MQVMGNGAEPLTTVERAWIDTGSAGGLPGDPQSGIGLTRTVLEALPPPDRKDEAMEAIIEGMLRAAEHEREDDTESSAT